MKKAKFVCVILLSFLLIKFLATYILNEIVILGYKNGIYSPTLLSFNKKTNINERYIVYYNEGNLFYQQARYDKAIVDYETALKKNPPKDRVCDIRINLTLSLVKNINTKDSKLRIKKLKEAKDKLYEDHCAEEEGDSGESQEAEALEKEIDDMIEEEKENLPEKEKEKEKQLDEMMKKIKEKLSGKGNEKGINEKLEKLKEMLSEEGKEKEIDELTVEIKEMLSEEKDKKEVEEMIEEMKEELKEGDPSEQDQEDQKIEDQLNQINKEASESRQRDLQRNENLDNYHFYSGKNW
ncbi:MAG: tetratricopeptide repeat protein [Bacilli bacterium]|nr:tetratricopeptide repeat protein [Bacilli bacterium]